MTVGDQLAALERGEGADLQRAHWYRNFLLMVLASAKGPLPLTKEGLHLASTSVEVIAMKNPQGEVVLSVRPR